MQIRSLRVRMALLFGGIGIAILLPLFWHVDRIMTRQLTAEHGRIVLDAASSTARALGEDLNERRREIELLARTYLFRTRDLTDAEVGATVDRLQASYPSYSWIGVADAEGKVLSATKGLLLGQDVSQRPWFVQGQHGIFLGDIHEALLLAKLLPQPDQAGPIRFIDVSVPIRDDAGTVRGVLGAHINWRWSEDLVRRLQPTREGTEGMEIFILDAKGKIIYPDGAKEEVTLPAALAAHAEYQKGRWSTAGDYVSAIAPVAADALISGLGWRVVVRQPDEVALRPVRELRQAFVATGLASAGLFVLIVLWIAAGLSRPLEELARAAKRIESGEEDRPLTLRSRTMEVDNLADALRGMTATLIRRREEVNEVNLTLEQKVTERTAELENANAALRDLARRDALTGLDNRRSTDERLHQEWMRLRRTGRSYAVLLMDVDHFKSVNDTHGHDIGDEVLKAVARILKASVRATDFVGRYGGEEFIVVLSEAQAADGAAIGEKIRRAIQAADMPEVGKVTISIGVAIASGNDTDEDEAVRRADELLYAAKRGGRNRVEVQDAAAVGEQKT